MMTGPMRSRFGITCRLEFYEEAEITEIVERAARLLAVPIEKAAAVEIARRCRRTPRISNRVTRRVRDYAQVRGDGQITAKIAAEALEMLEIDAKGLDRQDMAYLQTLTEKFGGGPTGLGNLSVALSEDPDTLEDVVEPYLIQIGFLERTPRGREATPAGKKYLAARS
jgi:Holliday junction DNA helicase RuvB